MSDSDETVRSDSDETLPPSDDGGCHSPDLFVDSPGATKGRRYAMNTSHSKTHDLSESDSEDNTSKEKPKHRESNNTKISYKSSNHRSPTCERKGKTSSPKLTHSKPTKHEHSEEKNGSNKKAFMDEFLNMSDSDEESDLEFQQNQIKLKALKQKDVPWKKEGDDKIYSRDSSKIKDDSKCNKSAEKEKFHFLDKQHKKDYSRPLEQSNAELKHSDTIGSYFKKSNKRDSTEYSPTGVKRKRSKSPVPQELRKAVTQILKENSNYSAKKKKPPCQYGQNCYRKNPTHFEEFGHPGDEDFSPSPKKMKLEPGSSSNLSTDSSKSYTPNTITSKKINSISPSLSKARSNSPSVSKVRSNSPSVSKISSVTPSTSKVMSRSSSASKVFSESPSTSKVKTHSPTSDCKVTRRPGSNPQTLTEKLQLAQPYGLFLTKVAGISDRYNTTYSMDIKDLLSPSMGNLEASCQFNFMFDIGWLMKQYPPQFRLKPLLIVHGEQGASKNALQGQGLPYDNIKFCQAKLEMMYGTHHTKMMLLLYNDGLRVIIHTSNLVPQDWHQKTQGMWISPVFPKLSEASKDRGDSVTHFKRDLLEYMQSYKAYQLKEWIDHVTKHDMSSAKVVIIGSTPGRHVDRAKSLWGHMKLRKVLQEHGPSQEAVKAWPVIGQFSSIGSMGPNKDNWLCGEWKQSLATTKSSTAPLMYTRLLLIFPSRHNVRLSLEGYPAGGSIPYTAKTAQKQLFLNDFFHVWKSEGRGRTRAMPHIKSYSRAMQDGSKAAWFIVTSANLSKAAWGALEKKGIQLMIRSYEIGVMFLPKFFDEGEIFPVTSDPEVAATSNRLLLPYDLPPTMYDKKDRPWMWDIPYMDLPDTNGNVWCPFSK